MVRHSVAIANGVNDQRNRGGASEFEARGELGGMDTHEKGGAVKTNGVQRKRGDGTLAIGPTTKRSHA